MVEDTNDTINKFNNFLENNYKKELLELFRKGEEDFFLDFNKLSTQHIELAERLLDNPIETLKEIKISAERFSKNKNINIRITGKIPKSSNYKLTELGKNHLDKLIKIRGMITSCSQKYIKCTSIKFSCPSCGKIITVIQLDNTYKEPEMCYCGRKGKFKEISSEKIDQIDLMIEELPEDVKANKTPNTIYAILNGLITENENIYLGARVELIGYVQKEQRYIDRRKSNTYDKIFMINSYKNIDATKISNKISKEEEILFEEIKNSKNPAKMISEFIYPDIVGHDKIKEMCIIKQFGGKRTQSGKRDWIHILLVGHTGTAKSDIAMRADKLNPINKFASATDTSGVGLTASVEKDKQSGRWVAKSGLLPKANGGVLLIDELDKMSIEHKNSLINPMEMGSFSLNKAGISINLCTETSISATANPKSVENFSKVSEKTIEVSEPLINRFDMVYRFLDIVDVENDQNIARKITSRDTFEQNENTFEQNENTFKQNQNTFFYNNNTYNTYTIHKYIIQCKNKNSQCLSTSFRVDDTVHLWYSKIRQISINSSYEGKKITPRIVETVYRIARAITRMKQKDSVTVKEIKKAIEYVEDMLELSEMDKIPRSKEEDIL